MQTLVIHNNWALGDSVCLSALFRDIQRAYPGKYRLYASGTYKNVFWRNNPHVEKCPDDPGPARLVQVKYGEGIVAANNGLKIHFLSWFHRSFQQATGIKVPVTEPKGDIHLSPQEKDNRPEGRYWVVVAGGKMDMTAKVWSVQYWQQTVDTLARLGVRVVQAGGTFNKHFQPTLNGVEQWVGKTQNERDFFSLIHGAEGVICGVTAAMHIAAVFDKPCVVIAGGREAPWWEGYTNCFHDTAFGKQCAPVKVEHTYLHTIGLLDCGVGNLNKGCWKDRTVPVEQADFVDPKKKRQLCAKPVEVGHQMVPACLKMITPDHVVEAVMNYYEKGILPPIGKPKGTYSLPLLPLAYPPEQEEADRIAAGLPPTFEDFKTKADELLAVPAPTPDTVLVNKATMPDLRAWGLDPGKPPILISENNWDPAWAKQLPKEEKPRAGERPEFAALEHPYVGGKFTLFVLGFGDHYDLLERCISSIVNTCPRHRFDLRVALNQPTQRVSDYVYGLREAGVVTQSYVDRGERRKYPAMREMFNDPDCPIETPYVCWFDDDSWCRRHDWMVHLTNTIVANHPHQGRLYGCRMYYDLMMAKREGAPREKWFQQAKWWKGRNLYATGGSRLSPNGSQIVFASGGFWALATHVIREADIPDERLNHNGGDITIGCQVTQAGYKVVDFSPRPKKEVIAWSDAPRRGYAENFPWA